MEWSDLEDYKTYKLVLKAQFTTREFSGEYCALVDETDDVGPA